MKSALFALFAAGVLASCAGTSRFLQYPISERDAKVEVGDRGVLVWFHRTDTTIFMQRTFAGTFAEIEAEPMPIWRAAAVTVLADAGCELIELYELNQGGRAWEGRYQCPDGRHIGAEEVGRNRARWMSELSAPDPLRRPATHN
jgi:hypothetical protein